MEGLQGHGGEQWGRMEEVILEPSFGVAIQVMTNNQRDQTYSGHILHNLSDIFGNLPVHINSVIYLGTY